jgi:hypothetical protein
VAFFPKHIRPARHVRIGAPPGVGDCYWVLTKLAAIRRLYGAHTLTMYVQKTSLTRALDWSKMVPQLVTATAERPFRPDQGCLTVGYSNYNNAGLHTTLWPNGVLDRGGMLADWLPELGPPDLAFPVNTIAPGRAPGAVVYASSDGVNAAWAPNLGPDYWRALIEELGIITGAPPTLIGAAWDANFSRSVAGKVVDLVGRTSLPQVAGIIQHARVVIGVISGMTILANHFRTPCVALRPIVPLNPRAWVAPEAPYLPVDTPTAPPAAELARLAASMMR